MNTDNNSKKRALTSAESTSTETAPKKIRGSEKGLEPAPSRSIGEVREEENGGDDNTIFDVTKTLGLEAGSRIEVRWELDFDDNENSDDNDNNTKRPQKVGDEPPADKSALDGDHPKSETRWWGGTLLAQDGRSHTLKSGNDEVTVAIHSIDYDPYPPSFPDRSIEDVCFLSNRSLLNVSSDSRTCWRLEGDSWSGKDLEEVDETNQIDGAAVNVDDDEISVASTSQEDGLREVLDTILKAALESSGVMAKMQVMERSTQSIMAERIASTKEKLITKFLAKLNDEENNSTNGVDKVITPELVQNVMTELGNELRG